MKDFYLLSSSLLYIFVSIFVFAGKPDVGIDPKYRPIIAAAIFLYGGFRLYFTYKRLRSNREDENN